MKLNFFNKWILSGIAVVLISVFTGREAISADSGSLPELYELTFGEYHTRLDNMIPRLLKKYNVPGLAIALIHEGRIDITRCYGYADNNKTVDENTLFQAASISKSFTAWAILKLVEQQKVELDAPVEKYLSRWHLPETAFNKNDITIRRLLSHTAGIGAHAYSGYSPEVPLPSLEEELSGTGSASGLKLMCEPGTKFIYSGAGYSLLQLVIEEVSGRSFTEFMKDEILNPLGMTASRFDYSPDMKANLAAGHDYFGNACPDYRYNARAAAGLYTSITDLSRFALSGLYRHNRNPVLTQESIELSFTPVKANYGLGFFNFKLTNHNSVIQHGGDNKGWASGYMFIPDTGEGIVLLANSENGQHLLQDIINSWTQWNAKQLQPFYRKIYVMRDKFSLAALVLGIIVIIHGIYLVITFTGKRRIWFFQVKKHTLAKILRFGLPVCFSLFWWLLFYTGLFLDGWQALPRLPYGFYLISRLVNVWSFLFLITAFFWKVKKRLKTNNKENRE